MQITHGASRVPEDLVIRAINDKITLMDVRGSNKTGYLYQTTWFDSNFEKTLECANHKYSKELLDKVIMLAKRIDVK